MKIISRIEAQEQGLKKFFTGKPCKHGHISERRVSGGQCLECCKTKSPNKLHVSKGKGKLRVDQLPAEVLHHFMVEAKNLKSDNTFWPDMFKLATDLGLRMAEARELTADMFDPETNVLTLNGAKQQKAHITKEANKALEADWITKGRNLVFTTLVEGGEPRLLASVAVDSIDTHKALQRIGERLAIDVDTPRKEFIAENKDAYRAAAEKKDLPPPRPIDLSPFPESVSILKKRVRKYADFCGYLFPAAELGSNRAGEWKPVSRQSIKRVIDKIHERLLKINKTIREALNGIRLGLSSLRKHAIQRVLGELGDMEETSKWVHHGNGEGSIQTTSNYLDRSLQKSKRVLKKLKTPKSTLLYGETNCEFA